MRARELARFTAACRIAIGAAFATYPTWSMLPWLGRDSRRPTAQLLARALGARDIVLGVGTLAALNDRRALTRWLRAALVADATDFAVTLLERDHLPLRGRVLVLAVAGAGVALGGLAATASASGARAPGAASADGRSAAAPGLHPDRP